MVRLQASRAQRQQLRRGERPGGSGDELASLQPSLGALPGPIPIPVPVPAASGSSSRPGAEGEAAGGSHGEVLELQFREDVELGVSILMMILLDHDPWQDLYEGVGRQAWPVRRGVQVSAQCFPRLTYILSCSWRGFDKKECSTTGGLCAMGCLLPGLRSSDVYCCCHGKAVCWSEPELEMPEAPD